jgi:hypothetical protein
MVDARDGRTKVKGLNMDICIVQHMMLSYEMRYAIPVPLSKRQGISLLGG